MKKLLIMSVLVMGALIVNAQRTPVKLADLPKGVSDSIAKDYPGYTIKETTKVVENMQTTFEVVIAKGMEELILTYDSEGKFLKKSDAKSGSVKETPKPAPSPSPTPAKSNK
jgi:hypothetical protein